MTGRVVTGLGCVTLSSSGVADACSGIATSSDASTDSAVAAARPARRDRRSRRNQSRNTPRTWPADRRHRA
ncbi:hypothetical protein [Plantactinospora sp. KBS50]|uniref:hypothetical protein n=1 Tax=Plantactinospora sp. KBS50 TaxID=2024580 RepID=UPI0018DF0CDC|nr:hypothetical protein [Plantactinospora sp. KBS50]